MSTYIVHIFTCPNKGSALGCTAQIRQTPQTQKVPQMPTALCLLQAIVQLGSAWQVEGFDGKKVLVL